MLIRVIAVGTRMPAWVGTAVDDYSKRLPPELALEWREVKTEARTRSGRPAAWMQKEAARIEQALPPAGRIVALDERGADLSTVQLAARLRDWQQRAQPVAILIGGPDGLDPALKSRADESIRLSSLTLPHPLVRVLLAEQLYRAWSVLAGHPYHRD
ncbi:MAG: 23S rRNA (pseudouridine(1915)-N(3))-methyltransferase RlmH [Limnobacter sp.]|nr:23S rRNA (pseudouridine(1915)-N(3))-methyltransferase RlmH [Limnobacter sp.]